jgi:hypothetical protein
VLRQWIRTYPEIEEAFALGREQEERVLHNKLRQMALDGNLVAALFILKCRHGWVEATERKAAADVEDQARIAQEAIHAALDNSAPALPAPKRRSVV